MGWQALLAGLAPQTRVSVRLGRWGSNAGGLAGGFGGSDASDASLRSFGQLGEQRKEAGRRFCQGWRLGRRFSSLWAARGATQVSWQPVLSGFAVEARLFL